ncbi:MAG: (E)-4-hydroxy-3-methylbut-2-enyl-diphosphate synthase, partial [Cyclobacteriaceae bacterium]|nr:(E)-4-hydroxy-3-methylbut-2-enyl-diphosphate synthase [Cyclobacteriaceae bacterium]
MNPSFCPDFTLYQRRKTLEVSIGDVKMGGDNPIRVQSMTTLDTMDTQGSVEQIIRMAKAGCEYARLTAPSMKEAENLGEIKKELRKRGYSIPLIADIHFTPNAAEIAARLVEKVRINPGNYVDKKKFQTLEYTDEEYANEIDRIRTRLIPLLKVCKEHGTALRIGTNHGSLSDRILSRYGDTPMGMVESALEFLRICEEEEFYNIVLSMKSSNPQVMVQAYRLLVSKLDEEGLKPYPLHLGVTEAGEGEDGRIKSALGIGTLLEDGLGDTIRVSLTEEPEYEIPVAKKLVERYGNRNPSHHPIPSISSPDKYHPFHYEKRKTHEVANFGESNVPRVIADYSFVSEWEVPLLKFCGHHYLPEPDKWVMDDQGADYIYSGNNPIPFMLPNGVREILDYATWINHKEDTYKYPLIELKDYLNSTQLHPELNIVRVEADKFSLESSAGLLQDQRVVVLLYTSNPFQFASMRRVMIELTDSKVPVVLEGTYSGAEEAMIYGATDLGGLLIDGFGDGIM